MRLCTPRLTPAPSAAELESVRPGSRILIMNPHQHDDLRGIWAVTWRALFLFPAALAVFFLLLLLVAAVILLPCFAGMFFFTGLWWQGAASLVAWAGVLGAWRRFRLGRFFESPPSCL